MSADPRRTGYVGGSAYYEERGHGPAPDEPRWSSWEWAEWRKRADAQHAAFEAWIAEHQDTGEDVA